MCGVVKKYVADYPSLTTAACLLVPAIGWFIYLQVSPYLQVDVGEINHGLVGEVYIGLAGVAAICGGFAGVIIVFGLTPSSDLFRRFRLDAGDRMVANWISVITNSFLAAAVGIAAGTLESLTIHVIGAFVFAAGGLLLLHSSVRSIWILHKLLTLVRNDDEKTQQESYGGFQP